MGEMADWNIDNALMPGDGSEADDCGFGCMRAELEQRIRELEEERERLRVLVSKLLEAHMDGYQLSGDEIDDAYAALEGG